MTRRIPLREAIARIDGRDPVLPSVLRAPPEPAAAMITPPSGDRRTISVEVRLDRSVFLRYRTLQHGMRQAGQAEPALRQIVSALLARLPHDPTDVEAAVMAWRATDPDSRRPYAERDLHRLRVDLPTGLVRRLEASLFALEVDGRQVSFSDVVRAALARGPTTVSELRELVADGERSSTGDIAAPAAEPASVASSSDTGGADRALA